MADISDKERGIGPETKALNRSATLSPASDAGAVQVAEAESLYWKPSSRTHHVVFPNGGKFMGIRFDVEFDFRAIGTGSKGTIEGTGKARGHNGKYEILKNAVDGFDMRVTIGTADKPKDDMDATLSIRRDGATVLGMLSGQIQEAGRPVPVAGRGTQVDPFRARFAAQEVVWYLP